MKCNKCGKDVNARIEIRVNGVLLEIDDIEGSPMGENTLTFTCTECVEQEKDYPLMEKAASEQVTTR